MQLLSSIIILSLACFCAAADILIADGSCVTIHDGDLVMHEKKSGHDYQYFLYMIPRGTEYNDQRWILVNAGGDYYKLQNKHSGRFMILSVNNYFFTVPDVPVRNVDYFKFQPEGGGKYDIVNNENGHLKSNGKNYAVYKGSDASHLTVKQCTE
uniref:Erythema protein SVEP-2 n=1 Tax=Simulium vittatum TaxID=7192 RepID=B5M0X6_SIMVI|nr:erythema protein SVEP-2 [Simulium vittatum]